MGSAVSLFELASKVTKLSLCKLSHQVELFYHSKETPATITKIEATLDKSTGEVIKHSPRYARHMKETCVFSPS